MSKSVETSIAAVAAGAAFMLLQTPTFADVLGDTYKGATITILVGYGAGGTYGKNSRLLANHLPHNISGYPQIVVQHMPGAGGLKSANYAFNVMPKDGHWLLMPPDGSLLLEMLRPKQVKYRTREFTWLGRVIGSNTTLSVRRDSGFRSVADLKKKPLTVASSGGGSGSYLVPALLNGLLGTKMNIVTGYKGSQNMLLSVEQGENQASALAWTAWQAVRPHWFGGKNSFAIPIVQSGFEREKGLENVPLILDFVKSDDEKKITQFLATASLIGRGLAFPPGVPSGLIEPMRQAFTKTVNSAAFVADAKKHKLPLNQKTGQEIQDVVDKISKMSPRLVKKARDLIYKK